MTATFDKLKALLEEKGTLTDDEISKAVGESGEMTAEESMWISAEIHERKRAKESKVTMEQFLEANKVLETAPEGSDEYNKAQAVVDAFLQGG